jgi:AhpD family alkylhydroperoxidase
MARLPYVELESAPDAVRQTLERLPVQLNIFRMMAHAETCFRPLVRLGTAILSEQRLDARLRELAILRIAQLSGARYEWVQHEPIARTVGVSETQIAALARGSIDDPAFADLDSVVLRFTTEVVNTVKASDATFAEMRRHFSPREIVELLLAIGFYMTIARLAETTATDVDMPAGTTVVDSLRREGAKIPQQ